MSAQRRCPNSMPFDAFFLASSGKKRMFFLPEVKTRRKSVFCAVEIFAQFAFLTAFFDDGADDDDCKEQHNDTCRHRKGDRDADDKDKRTNDTAADKGDKAAQHDNGKKSGKQNGGDLVHQAQFIR